VEIKDVESNAFRRVLEFIYNSGEISWEATDSLDYWSLMQVCRRQSGSGIALMRIRIALMRIRIALMRIRIMDKILPRSSEINVAVFLTHRFSEI
jgi:hypothetical protein